MAERRPQQSRLSRPPGKSQQERTAEFDATQARLKAEAAERRKRAQKDEKSRT